MTREAARGRHVDDRLASLGGEAAGQDVGRGGDEGRRRVDVYERAAHEGAGTYYDKPVLKEPVWMWYVPAYFFAGGAAGAALVLGATAQTADREGLRGLVGRSRKLALGGLLAGTAFLVADLGRPERFLNMLRVFRPTSPMSVGSWILATSGPLAAIAALLADADGLPGAVGDFAGLAAGPVGLPLAAYTAVLLADTAVPLWQGTRRTLPALFAASSMATATAALDLGALDDTERAVTRRLGLAAKAAEVGLTLAVEAEAGRTPGVARPLKEGAGGALWSAATAMTAASVALSLLPRGSGARRRVAAALALAGSAALRFAFHHAGKASARDPAVVSSSRGRAAAK